jgi:DNA alkylation repair enzyme
MRAYLKSNLPCSGVPVPLTRSIVKSEARQRPPRSVAALGATAAALWRSAGYREERHAATALTGLRLARAEISLLPLYQEMITTGAWWDHVDEVAHRICAILLAHPDRTRPVLLAWSRDPDLWLRRSAVISQLDAREATDTALLRAGHPRERGRSRVLHSQGHRLGAAPVRPNRPGLGPLVRIRACRAAQPALPSRSDQAPGGQPRRGGQAPVGQPQPGSRAPDS